MYNLDSAFKSEKNKPANSPIYLYTLHDYDGIGTNLNFAEWDADVTYNGVTYSKFPIKHEDISENTKGEIDNVKIIVANVNRVIQAYLEDYDLRGKKVTIKIVWANQLMDVDAYIDYIFYIDTYIATEQTVEFILSTKYDIIDLEIPVGRYYRNYCRWKFKGTECGYSGAETTCDKRKATCKTTMNNITRYGGFPSVPTHKVFV